ncbi:MAG: ATP synthase F1 subunit gamma [Pseudomonadota bacterium]
MASLKDIRHRIDAAKNTQKVTKAMKLVAVAKLKRAQMMAQEGRIYSSAVYDSVTRVSRRLGARAPGLWRRPRTLDVIDLIVITSDRGLCGGFNENLLRVAEDGIADHISHNIDVKIYVIGKKGYKHFLKHGYDPELVTMDGDRDAKIAEMVEMVCNRYLSGKSSGCNLGFNRFVTAAKQEITFWNLLPLYHIGSKTERHLEYLYEPGREEALHALSRESLKSTLKQAMLESDASELAARMSAMDGATKNADDMIAHLTSVYNRARQEAITSELMDIVNGAEALK